ncbi:MAG: transglycosylase SLT domain-containing protein [Candidatus Eremiobacteraeota bacterium]|nr:transglycosylase SLT domain-containing protein [Candidatus Eremiobacteraeota bacterium]
MDQPNPLPGIPHGAEIAAAAARYHLDPVLLAAVAQQESDFGRALDRNGRGDHGHGYGIFQLDDQNRPGQTPRAQAELDRAASDPAYAADVAARMLSDNLRIRHGNMHEALSMYNAGSPHAVGTRTRFPDGEILGYADAVERRVGSLRAQINRRHAHHDTHEQPHLIGSFTDPHAVSSAPVPVGPPGTTVATFHRSLQRLVIATPDGERHDFPANDHAVAPTHGRIRTTDNALRLLLRHPVTEIVIEDRLSRARAVASAAPVSAAEPQHLSR